jgi:Arc/MetJ-type ribon-helix-helix transcriptional regulator
MELHFTSEQEALIREAVASGRYRNAEEAVQDAMARWEERERARAETLAALDEAEADLESGRYSDYSDETLDGLAVELKREGRSQRDSART